jgi:hypothetical protein
MLISTDYLEKIIEELKSKNDIKTSFGNLRKIIADAKVREFDELFRFLFDNLDEFAPDGIKSMMIYHIADGQYRSAIVNTDSEIQVAQMFVNILKDLR